MRINPLVSLAISAPIIAFSGAAQASTFTFNSEVIDAGAFIDNRAGTYKNITTSFDDQSQQLSWSSTFSENQGTLADGGWLVLSDGENPRGGEQKYAMFYMDGDAKKLTAYTYNGSNGSNSWGDSTYLGSWALEVAESAGDRTFSFDLDMKDINGRMDLGKDWEGARFAENIGIWFHSVNEFEAKYNDNGSLMDFGFVSEGWYDTNKPVPTKKVPEPGAMAGLVAVGLMATKYLRQSQG